MISWTESLREHVVTHVTVFPIVPCCLLLQVLWCTLMYSEITLIGCFAPEEICSTSHAHFHDTCTKNHSVVTWCAESQWCVCVWQGHLCPALRLQVINIINAAQESSPVTVAEALDRVLEILRTTELYSPQLASKEDDPHTNDLVGGLMSVRRSWLVSVLAFKWTSYTQKLSSLDAQSWTDTYLG